MQQDVLVDSGCHFACYSPLGAQVGGSRPATYSHSRRQRSLLATPEFIIGSRPSEKEEQEYAVIRQLPQSRTPSLSFFRHIQHGGPNDQLSQGKLKCGVSF